MDWPTVLSLSQLDSSSLQNLIETCKLQSPIDILLYSPHELYELSNRSVDLHLLQNIWNIICNEISIEKPEFSFAQRLSFMNDRFDEYFDNCGIPPGCLVEIAGNSGAGKSNICLQLAISCLSSFQSQSVLYFCTEGNFPFRRLFEILQQKFPTFPLDRIYSLTDRLKIQHIADYETLLHVMRYHLEVAVNNYNVKLIIIDSIVCDSRGERELSSKEVTQVYVELSELLKTIASRFNLFVICANQVMDIITEGKTAVNYNLLATLERPHILTQSIPCLGISWASSVNMRIFVWKDWDAQRKLLVLWGLGKKKAHLPFSIESSGIV